MIVVEPFVLAALVLALIASFITDIRSQKIPNWITYPVIVLALLAYSTIDGYHGLLYSAEGLGLGLALLMPFYAMGGTGAGDVKLMAAVGAALGPGSLLCAFFSTGIVGGVMAAGILLLRPERTKEVVFRVCGALKTLVLAKELGFSRPAPGQGGLKLSYGVAISIGALAYIFFEIYRGGISFHLL
ncbi:MAG: prepilin peptidase [Syntrophobacteraceae bacterium]|nr:prepilin peptidase [Syntrophobacteraceae bacterium]